MHFAFLSFNLHKNLSMHVGFYSENNIKCVLTNKRCLSKDSIAQTIRPTDISQYRSNPFCNSHKKSLFHKMFDDEFRNYKKVPKEEEPDCELLSIKETKSKKQAANGSSASLSSNDFEEMECEIKAANEITSEIEKDLKEMVSVKPISDVEYVSKMVALPPRKFFKNTIFLDLDETLIHSVVPTTAYKCLEDALYINQNTAVYVRPGLKKFLAQLHQQYELILFTAADKEYTDAILNAIDPLTLISYRFYRDNCIARGIKFVKDLRIFSNRDIKSCILIDNSVVSFMSQLDNGIPIASFIGSKHDKELYDLLSFLAQIYNADDVRPHLQSRYALSIHYQQLLTNYTSLLK